MANKSMNAQLIEWSTNDVATCWYSQAFDYGVCDAKGRVIGGCVVVDLEFPYVRQENGSWAHDTAAMPFYSVRHVAQRNGCRFGAIAASTPCVTLEEAKALGEKKIAEAKARYVRAVTKGVGRQFAGRVSK